MRLKNTLDINHHLSERLLMQLKIEHADLDALADRLAHALPVDELLFKRLKKRRLLLRDKITCLELSLLPPGTA